MAGALEGDIFIGPKAEVCGMLQMKTVKSYSGLEIKKNSSSQFASNS